MAKEIIVKIVYKGEGDVNLNDLFPDGLNGMTGQEGSSEGKDAILCGNYVIIPNP